MTGLSPIQINFIWLSLVEHKIKIKKLYQLLPDVSLIEISEIKEKTGHLDSVSEKIFINKITGNVGVKFQICCTVFCVFYFTALLD